MKVGLFFGSFNPIHSGHVAVAEYLAEHTDLNEIWFIVSPQNPFKPAASLLDDEERMAMVKLAINNNPKLKASDVEFNLPKPSYTINTINHLKEKFPQHQFVLIIGEDNLPSFHQWKEYEQILKECMVYVYPRSNVEMTTLHFHPKVKVIKDAPLMDISATDIRYAIQHNENVGNILPDTVWKHIEEKGFYKK
jgi:nicotinate-nucleotide adenylyltransferase